MSPGLRIAACLVVAMSTCATQSPASPASPAAARPDSRRPVSTAEPEPIDTPAASESGAREVCDQKGVPLDSTRLVCAEDTTDQSLEGIAAFTQLESVTFSHCPQLTDAGLAYLKRLNGLEWLTLTGSQITDEGLARVVEEHPRLRGIGLDGTRVTDAGVARLVELITLEIVSLSDTDVTDSSLEHLARLPKLKEVYVDETKVTAAGVSNFQRQRPNCHLSDSLP